MDVPTETLLSQEFADARACVIDPDVGVGEARRCRGPLDAAGCEALAAAEPADTENISTTHLSVVDRWGNAVAYTLTIEQTGGSGMTVPGRGFLLNNELTDFNFSPDERDRIRTRTSSSPASARGRRCRPRSCSTTAMSATSSARPVGR